MDFHAESVNLHVQLVPHLTIKSVLPVILEIFSMEQTAKLVLEIVKHVPMIKYVMFAFQIFF